MIKEVNEQAELLGVKVPPLVQLKKVNMSLIIQIYSMLHYHTILWRQVRTGFGSADEWHRVAGDSKVSLCPRGYGRTAFHLFEILQLGLIPVHVGKPCGEGRCPLRSIWISPGCLTQAPRN